MLCRIREKSLPHKLLPLWKNPHSFFTRLQHTRLLQTKKNAFKEMVLETGQVWQLASGTVQIVRIGKTLVHYKHFKTMQQRGVSIQMQSHRDLIAALRKNGAMLVQLNPGD